MAEAIQFQPIDPLRRYDDDGAELDGEAILQRRGSKEKLQSEVFGCVADELMKMYSILHSEKINVAMVVANLWIQRYSKDFRELCCIGNTDMLKQDFFAQIRALSVEQRVNAVFDRLGFVDGLKGFIEKENSTLEDALQKPMMIDGIMRAIRRQLH